MKLSFKALPASLENKLAPVYLVSGDEPLQLMEATDLIRNAAVAQGFSERRVLDVETGFDWSELHGEAASMSLFAAQKLIDLRMPTGKPGREGGKALQTYCVRPPNDTILLIRSAKLDRSAKSSAWLKALDKVAVWVEIWDLNPAQTLQFVSERLQQAGFHTDRDGARALTERVEGNLLAAVQEIEKLRLIQAPGQLGAEMISSLVADSARYDAFELIDAALAGDRQRVIKMLWGLKGEGVAVNQILWSVSRDVRILADYSALQEAGQSPQPALKSVWGMRQSLLQRASQRHSASRWASLLRRCAEVDQLVKGMLQGNAWEELLQLLLWIAGQPVITADRSEMKARL